jgi:NDP-sugar pyrophosphorylase family protein
MYTVIIPVIWEENEFKQARFEKTKPLIDVLGKSLLEKCLESFYSKNFVMRFIFIINENQLNEELKNILNKHGKIIEKKPDESLGDSISQLKNYIDKNSGLIITNFSHYINWDFDNFLKHCDQYEGCIPIFYSINSKYPYLKVDNYDIVEKIKYRPRFSNYTVFGMYFFKRAEDFFKHLLNINSKNIYINDIFDIDVIYNEFIENKNISIYNVYFKNIYLLNSPKEFHESIKRLKQDFYEKN